MNSRVQFVDFEHGMRLSDESGVNAIHAWTAIHTVSLRILYRGFLVIWPEKDLDWADSDVFTSLAREQLGTFHCKLNLHYISFDFAHSRTHQEIAVYTS